MFQPDETVRLVPYTDLRVLLVYRQHIVEWDLQFNRKRDVSADPQSEHPLTRPALTVPTAPVPLNNTMGNPTMADDLAADNIDDTPLNTDDEDAIADVRRQNMPLTARRPGLTSTRVSILDSIPRDEMSCTVVFIPPAVEHQLHNTIVSPVYQGNNA